MGCVFSVVLSFLRNVFRGMCVLSCSEFSVSSSEYFSRSEPSGLGTKKYDSFKKILLIKKRLKKKVPSPEGSEEVKEITIGEKGSESRGSRGCSGI